jgi:hypothetical protein
MGPKPSFFKILFIVLVPTVLLFGLFLGVFFFLFGSSENESDYRPQFKTSSFELVRGDGFRKPHLYYRTDEKHVVGESVASLQFITVGAKGDPQNGQFQLTSLDNTVDGIGPGYLVFTFGDQNFDCFAVYKNKKLVAYDRKDFGRLPTPGDAWMCKGFDFKNAMDSQLQ